METQKNRARIFLVLVPHRDIRIKLQKFSELIYKNAVRGAYTFPHVAPLFSISRPLNTDELKHIAHSLRKATGGEKINIQEMSASVFSTGAKEMDLFGYKLDLDISGFFTRKPEGAKEEFKKLNLSPAVSSKIKTFFSPIVTGACLIPKDSEQQSSAGSRDSRFNPQISFRAAAVANMFWQPVKIDGENCFKWKIGKLCWLPKSTLRAC